MTLLYSQGQDAAAIAASTVRESASVPALVTEKENRMKWLLLLIAPVVLAACGGKVEAPPETHTSAATAMPTRTPTPRATATPLTRNTVQGQILEVLRAMGEEKSLGMEAVRLARFNNDGVLELEYQTMFVSRDHQPHASYQIASAIATFFDAFEAEQARWVARGEFRLSLTTYSSMGDYRYGLTADLETLHKLGRKQISQDEWIALTGAGWK